MADSSADYIHQFSFTMPENLIELFYRLAASGCLPRQFFVREAPKPQELPARTGDLMLEIVSHCWQYASLLVYQLSSLALYPPTAAKVRMTVFYSKEDQQTVEALNFFSNFSPSNVLWNWSSLKTPQLLRRAIGRNAAALSTKADWVWFTDCDQVFRQGCLDDLAAQLQGRNDLLLYPRVVNCGFLPAENDNSQQIAAGAPALKDINPGHFIPVIHTRAIGPLQITHGDAARKLGYCKQTALYQRPARRTWRKLHEDRVFRWLLGTPGKPVEVCNLYRIEHRTKGRDASKPTHKVLRQIRQWARQYRQCRR
ncbi:MAG: hypothetical protein M2R45_04143 [Verrucomicrobia subdivision 3 bacterium]|nr:hypothetical protein [Limisphaerales bacterium]MCS1417718.1 hypothetical protein [Limisphaerales bacterium]